MIYDVLASYYDALVKDDEATAAWVALIQRHMQGNEIMEVACGSGEITIALAQKGYHMHASDISPAMIRAAKAKPGAAMVDWRVMDMRQLQGGAYDGILCLCDSFNYLLEEAEVSSFFRSVYAHLRKHGVFIVDMHSQDRLKEFAEEYNEAGRVGDHEYQWTIESEDDCIYQTFAFYDEDGRPALEQHIQRVYDPEWIMEQLQACGLAVQVFTEFTREGITEGEKQFYVCRKENA